MTPFDTFIQEKVEELSKKYDPQDVLEHYILKKEVDFLTTTLAEAKEVIKKELEGKFYEDEDYGCTQMCLSEVKDIIKSL